MLTSNRTSRLLGAGALVLAASALAGCSTDMVTDQIYTPGPGTNHRASSVDVLNATVVSSEDDKGTLVVTLVNNRLAEAGSDEDPVDRLVAVEGDVQGEVSRPVRIPSGGMAVLATATESIEPDAPGIPVTGDFTAGDFVTVVFRFANAESVELEVPVMANIEGSVYAGQDGDPHPAPAEADEAAGDEGH